MTTMPPSQSRFPNQHAHAFTLRDFTFASGQSLAELRLSCLTLGTKRTDAAGRVTNAALLLHNTTGTAETFLAPGLGGELFGPGQPLDLARWFVIVPDMIGFGASSKPSDGLAAGYSIAGTIGSLSQSRAGS